MPNVNEAIVAYLQTRYTVSNPDAETLIARYLAENPSSLTEQTAVMQALIAAAVAAA